MTLTLASALVLTGCTAPPPQTVAVSSPTVAPVFASDEEALAAAVEAYEKYLAVSDQIAQEGGAGADRFEDVVTDEWRIKEEQTVDELIRSARRQTGESTFEEMRLQKIDQIDQAVIITAYACLDLSAVQYVDTVTGANAVSPEMTLIPVEVTFALSTKSPKTLLLEGNGLWSGVDFCSSR